MMQGPQTATVVGKTKESLTDKYGRIKFISIGINSSKDDDNLGSCWIPRFASRWRGKKLGKAIYIPEWVKEVLVDFYKVTLTTSSHRLCV